MQQRHVFRNGLYVLLLIIFTFYFLGRGTKEGVDIAILGAFPEETAWIKSQTENLHSVEKMGIKFLLGKLEGKHIAIVETSIGKVNAAMTTTLLLEHFLPQYVIFTGVAGGLNPDLLPGDIVIGERTVQHDLGDFTPQGIIPKGMRNPLTSIRNPVYFAADSLLLTAAQAAAAKVDFEPIETSAGKRYPAIIYGTITTGDAFIAFIDKKQELRDLHHAEAVEMEGAAVAQICYQHGYPLLVIRCLSDNSDENAEVDFEKFYEVAARNANRLVLEIVKGL
ncbi:5'-methylthioadenosine/adenosylhomocysteine nucleosidase [bacterium]|nr:5'-methylthioadenosine/adenosylhomocysteine nucleosidase [bacterium]MBU1881068.1 5'-methylthioadenosine/adenosylhomocysteine nucleosidase [bacterium]